MQVVTSWLLFAESELGLMWEQLARINEQSSTLLPSLSEFQTKLLTEHVVPSFQANTGVSWEGKLEHCCFGRLLFFLKRVFYRRVFYYGGYREKIRQQEERYWLLFPFRLERSSRQILGKEALLREFLQFSPERERAIEEVWVKTDLTQRELQGSLSCALTPAEFGAIERIRKTADGSCMWVNLHLPFAHGLTLSQSNTTVSLACYATEPPFPHSRAHHIISSWEREYACGLMGRIKACFNSDNYEEIREEPPSKIPVGVQV